MEPIRRLALLCCALALNIPAPASACSGPGAVVMFEMGSTSVSDQSKAKLQNLALWASGNEDEIAAIWILTSDDAVQERHASDNLASDRAKSIHDLLVAYGISENLIRMAAQRHDDPVALGDLPSSAPRAEVRLQLKVDRDVPTAISPGVFLAC